MKDKNQSQDSKITYANKEFEEQLIAFIMKAKQVTRDIAITILNDQKEKAKTPQVLAK